MDADRKDIEEFDNDYDDERGYTPKEVVTALIETGWIDEIDGAFYIHDWDVWQEFWYKAKDRRIKDAERKRESRKRKIRAGKKTENTKCFNRRKKCFK